MEISKELLRVLACPITKERLLYDKENSLLVSPSIALGFPIMDGIPILLKDEAMPVAVERIKDLLEKEAAKEQELLETNIS